MRIFQCGNCSHPLFFENITCENCGHLVGYNPSNWIMNTFSPNHQGDLLSDRAQEHFKYCKNHQKQVCNWLIPIHEDSEYCQACALNRNIPDYTDKKNFEKWHKLEVAKHRLIYQLLRLNLKFESKMKSDDGLCFDFIARQGEMKIMTGHANGVVTILLSEADSVLREQMRTQMSEPYRTLIGHFRHEVGHYFWDQLIATNQQELQKFRAIFGDESISYSESLKTYYANGAQENWQENYISKYATSHPWEDWAESWAHYLHIMDMVETAYFFGLSVKPTKEYDHMTSEVSFDPYQTDDFKKIIDKCIPLAFAVNSMNRSMGIPDVYPFVVNDRVITKMNYIHRLLKEL